MKKLLLKVFFGIVVVSGLIALAFLGELLIYYAQYQNINTVETIEEKEPITVDYKGHKLNYTRFLIRGFVYKKPTQLTIMDASEAYRVKSQHQRILLTAGGGRQPNCTSTTELMVSARIAF